MGRLRLVPKVTEPGFIHLPVQFETLSAENSCLESRLEICTRRGTVIHVDRTMSLKQIARFVRMLEMGHGLG